MSTIAVVQVSRRRRRRGTARRLGVISWRESRCLRCGALPYDRVTVANRESPQLPTDVRDLFARMPKAELHLHLDGSLRPTTALELARQRGLDEGMDLAAMRARLTAPERCLDQADLLRAFDLPIAIMQDRDALARVTRELVEDVATDGTRYVEIRWAPALHLVGGLDLRGSISAVVEGARSGMAAVAAAGTPVEVRLIAVALRSLPPDMSVAVAETAVHFVEAGLTGFDLAGREQEFPDPRPHLEAFEVARAGGLGITIHAGEWGGAAQVRHALIVNPARIAHGAPAAGDPGLIAELIARDVTLDLCPTSNVQTQSVPSLAEHPLARLARSGAPVTLSTDDRTVSDVTLIREYERAYSVIGLSATELWQINMRALRVAFLQHDEALRARLIAEFEAFAESEPLVADAG
jgi:adenosine deaminase